MTTEQFDSIAALISLRKSNGAMAAFRHLVHGDRVVDAAKWAGCSPQAASNCIRRVKKAQELAKVAA
jgi:hypothetical protein